MLLQLKRKPKCFNFVWYSFEIFFRCLNCVTNQLKRFFRKYLGLMRILLLMIKFRGANGMEMTTTQRKIDDLLVSNFHLNDFTRLFKSFSPWIIRFAQAWSMNSIFAKPGESYETEKLSCQRGCWRCLFKRILLPNPSMHMTSCLMRNRYRYSRNPKFSKMSGSAHHNMKEVTTPLLTTSTAFQGVGRKEFFFF